MHNKSRRSTLNINFTTLIIFLIVLSISAIAHSFNMFNFPYYENDEGVYMSQSWSLINTGEMAPYTYWYDHAPAGWMFISLWILLSGGFYTFGFSLNSGRVFMMILHVLSTLLIMLITKKITRSNFPAIIAGLIFSLTPIGLYFHRRILLDNIMTFWTLLSYFMVVKDKLKISDVLLSAIFFGIAVLTKENAVFFIPGFLITLYVLAHKYHKHLAIIKWLVVSGSVISLYFLYALLKGELFPSGTILGGNNEHVSLIETLKYQSSRDGGSIFNIENSSFWRHFFLWIKQDPFIIIFGLLSNVLLLALTFIQKKSIYLGVVALGLFFWFFLMRGGIVIEFYIVPLLAILSILIAIVIHELISWSLIFFSKTVYRGIYFGIIFNLCLGYLLFAQESRSFGQNSSSHLIFESKQTLAQIEAVEWVRKHVDPKSLVVIDNHSYIDLQDINNPSGIYYSDAEWYWKVDQDKEIKVDLLNNDPKNIDLIALTPQMMGDLQTGTSPLTTEALNNSKIWKSFEEDGWSVQLWRPYYPEHLLKRSWISYKNNFIENGRVIDLQENITTSEGQSYALLRAVWLNDKEMFDQVLSWTITNLKQPNGLYSWKYGESDTGELRVLDKGSASDADQDIALSLLFAYKKWGEERYLIEAKETISGIWNHEIKIMNGGYYLLPGPWAKDMHDVIFNPSYFSPYSYRIFSEVNPENNWSSVIDTGYIAIDLCSKSDFGLANSVFLPGEWCSINSEGVAVRANISGLSSIEYSYNAFRVPWKLALDYQWYNEPRALNYLNQMDLLLSEWQTKRKISVAYTHEGATWENYESVAAYGANIGLFKVIDATQADQIYQEKIKEKFYENDTKSYWEDPDNYYTQNWAWFGTALYSDNLPNIWEESN